MSRLSKGGEAAGLVGVLFITGGSRGIGAATARVGATHGYAVVVNHRSRRDAADAVVSDIAAARMFAEVERRHGPLAALVNSAGIDSGNSAAADVEAGSLVRATQRGHWLELRRIDQ